MRELFEARRRGEPDQPLRGRHPPIAGVILKRDLVCSPAYVGNLGREIREDGFELRWQGEPVPICPTPQTLRRFTGASNADPMTLRPAPRETETMAPGEVQALAEWGNGTSRGVGRQAKPEQQGYTIDFGGPLMIRIRLPNREWIYDENSPLGRPGGFGAVFVGGSSEEPVAVKRLHLNAAQAAHREMRLAHNLAGRSFNHVMPILDAGEDAESGGYFVVMPLAQGTLQETLDSGAQFSDAQAAEVLLQIASGLAEVEDIVHRDLKPANILYHQGIWKIADFGIARFVEESTSLATLKECLSPPYAAPEQWEHQRATAATDIYALGCVGYALLTGRPPFPGPTAADYKQQHLFSAPNPLSQATPRLRSLLSMMLRKAPESRPSPSRIRAILNDAKNDASGLSGSRGFQSLFEANVRVAETESEEVRQRREANALIAARKNLFVQGELILKEVMNELGQRVLSAAPSARLESSSAWSLSLGPAKLWIRRITETIPRDAFRQSDWDVVHGATIGVEQTNPRYVWSASLWYAKLPNETAYRWVEMSYFRPLSQEGEAPYAITDPRQADSAAGRGMHSIQIAWGPQAIDDENLAEFCERWATLLAKGTQGGLSHPSSLPLRGRFW